eukprot:3952894-Amphidinium_carterae.1
MMSSEKLLNKSIAHCGVSFQVQQCMAGYYQDSFHGKATPITAELAPGNRRHGLSHCLHAA